MGGAQDSVQTALRLYNEGKLNEARVLFEKLNESHPSDNKTNEYAGIVSLRLGDYDQALKHFRALDALNLYANPGKFYVALTLLKRNGPGDAAEAKQLLQQVTDQGLEHDADARKLLEKM
jgi:predicted Zn-dependent protease